MRPRPRSRPAAVHPASAPRDPRRTRTPHALAATRYRRDPSTPLPDGSYFPIHKITELAALTRSIAVHTLHSRTPPHWPRAKRSAHDVTDAPANDIVRILGTKVSAGRREGLGMAGPFAAMYETRHAHAPACAAVSGILLCSWSVCVLVWIVHVFHECVSI